MNNQALLRLLCLSLAGLITAGAGAKTIVLSDLKDFDAIQAKVAENARPKGFNINYGSNNTTCTGEFYITLIPSDKWLVAMTCENEEDLKYFDIKQEGKTLVLISKNKKMEGVKHNREECRLKAEVTVGMPELRSLDISGIHSVKVDGNFDGKSLSVDMSGITTLEGLSGKWESVEIDLSGVTKCTEMDMQAESMKIDVSGATEMEGIIQAGNVLLDCSGAGSIAFTSLKANSLELDNSGACKLKIGKAEIGTLEGALSGAITLDIAGKFHSVELGCSGGGEIELSGQANDFNLEASGMAEVKCKELSARNAEITLSGCAEASITVTEQLNYDVGMMATLDYYGKPKTVKSGGRENVTAH